MTLIQRRRRHETTTPEQATAAKAAEEAKIAADVATAQAHTPTAWTLPAHDGTEATVQQNNFIDRLVEQKGWKAEAPVDVERNVRQHGLDATISLIDAYAAGSAAYAVALTDLSVSQASAVIDALKAW